MRCSGSCGHLQRSGAERSQHPDQHEQRTPPRRHLCCRQQRHTAPQMSMLASLQAANMRCTAPMRAVGAAHPRPTGSSACCRASERRANGVRTSHTCRSSAVTTETVTSDAAAAIPAPYRVTEATIADITSLYKSCLQEYDYEVEEAWVEGTIPAELQGTYFRNGPGLQVNNPNYKRHTFDGDGMVLSFSFQGGRVRFRNKYVRTQGFLDEQAAGRPVHRTAFTRGAADGNPLFNPFDFTLKNVANTGVLAWGGKLYALYESGLPHELRPATLETLGTSRVNGLLETPVLAAHYRVVREEDGSRTWVAFSSNSGLGGTELIFYEIADDGRLRATPVHAPLAGATIAMVHDIAVSEDYYIVVAGPINFSPTKFVTEYFTSRCSIAECLVYHPSGVTKVHLIPRPRGKAAGAGIQILEAPPMFTFHHVNAYQLPAAAASSSSTGDGSHGGTTTSSSSSSPAELLVLDTVGWDSVSFDANQYNLTPEYYSGGARSQLRRLVFQLPPAASLPSGTNNTTSSSSVSPGRLLSDQQVVTRCVEFPSVAWDMHAKPHTYIYCCGDMVDHPQYWGPAQAVLKVQLAPTAGVQAPLDSSAVTLDVWEAGPRCIVNEPLFVPRPGAAAEDDGWVLVTVHDAVSDKGKLVILDAQRLSQGPVATLHLPHFLPAGLHGSWCDQVFGAEETGGAAPKWKPPVAIRPL